MKLKSEVCLNIIPCRGEEMRKEQYEGDMIGLEMIIIETG